MWQQFRKVKWLSWLWLVSSVLVGGAILTAPALPWAGVHHEPHERTQRLLLKSGKEIEQTVQWEAGTVTQVIVWLDTPQVLPKTGHLVLTAKTPTDSRDSVVSWSDIPETGATVFTLQPPLSVKAGQMGTLLMHLDEGGQQVKIQFQIDETKYPEGRLVQPAERPGDLAFQVNYTRPALGSWVKQWGYALLILLAGVWLAWQTRRSVTTTSVLLSRSDIWQAALLGLVVAAVYGWLLLKPGIWLGPSDFSKDISYVTANKQAVQAGAWPIWSHFTCGGMLLLGNPEGNTISIATLLALWLPPERALLLTLAIEGGIAAAGAFLLGRLLGLRVMGSLLAAIIASLSPTYAYRIVEGFSMIGGAVAWAPWVFVGLIAALRTHKITWALLSGLSLAAMLLRGDVHIILMVVLCIMLWCVAMAIVERRKEPLLILITIGVIAFWVSSIKILPFLEQAQTVSGDLHPLVAELIKQNLLVDVLFHLPDRNIKIPVLHGEFGENYGNFGSYIGLLPVVLAVISLTRKSSKLPGDRYRWVIWLTVLLTFAISEGYIFEHFIRHLGTLGILFRVPTRSFSVFVIWLGILAGLGIDQLSQRLKPPWAGQLVVGLITLYIVVDLVTGTSQVLMGNMWWRNFRTLPTPSQPTLVEHLNSSHLDERHASTLIASNYLLPEVCGDQNSPPLFIRRFTGSAPLTSVPAELKPNKIILSDVAGPADIDIQARFVNAWIPDHGTVLASETGSLELLLPQQPAQTVTVSMVSATRRAQQLLLLGTVLIGLWWVIAVA